MYIWKKIYIKCIYLFWFCLFMYECMISLADALDSIDSIAMACTVSMNSMDVVVSGDAVEAIDAMIFFDHLT